MERGAGSKGLDAACVLRLLFGAVLLTGCGEPRESVVATVDGDAILPGEVSVEMRAMLWRRGETWEGLDEATRKARREEGLERCVTQRLLKGFAGPATKLPAKLEKASEDEFQQFLKQFEGPDGWKRRLELQGGEVKVRERIAADVVQGDAIETWLRAQRNKDAGQQEQEAREWFEGHREEWRMAERARVSHLFLTGHDVEKPDRSAEMAEMHRKLMAGEASFESLAAKFSDDERSKKVGGALGWITRDRVPEDFAKQVFAVPLGKPSAPFRTKLGWHIVVVHERQASRLLEFAEVKDEVVARLDQPWREAAVKRLVQELREKAKVEVNEGELQGVEAAAY